MDPLMVLSLWQAVNSAAAVVASVLPLLMVLTVLLRNFRQSLQPVQLASVEGRWA